MGAAADQDRADLLRSFIRVRRFRLDRVDVGLLPRVGGRPGLSQDDLAEATGYSTRIISQLEQGRLRSPSPQLLQAVTAALRLRPSEREIFWTLAARSAPPAQRYATRSDPRLERLIERLHPNPAYVTDAAWRVLAANRAVADWFVDFDRLAPDRRNVAWWLFCDPHARHVLVDWAHGVAEVVLGRLLTTWARWPDDPALAALVGTLRADSAFVDRAWQSDPGAFLDRSPRVQALRRPGHTDPDQADDVDQQVKVDMLVLEPSRPDDERRVVAFLLPDGEARPAVRSSDGCAACARHRGAGR